MQELNQASAVELARRIRTGASTSREIVEAHLAQIDRVNPGLNAVVAFRREAALAEADRADALVREKPAASLGPLHGVPCTIKECFALEGMPNTSGLVARQGLVAERDATAVRRLRKAGAIPLGVTNISELCMWMESENPVYGRTNNPYDPKRTVGGSSGGEGAIVGAGGSPFGLGSDIGGSIRMPAFFNGVFGHKPSGGLVPATGQYPLASDRALSFLGSGPLCRRAEDLMPILRILAGPDGEDAACVDLTLEDPEKIDPSALRVFDCSGTPRHPVSAELVAVQRRAADHLSDRGAQVESIRLPELEHAFEIWSSMLAVSSDEPFTELLGQGRAVSPWGEFARCLVGASEFTLMSCLLAVSERLVARFPKHQARMVDLGRQLQHRLFRLLGDGGVLLLPSYVRTAPKHGQPLRRQLLLRMDYAYTCVLNPMELPVTQVPLGLSREGLPLGVQVAARHGNDALCIAAAMALEEGLGGWIPPRLSNREEKTANGERP